MFCFNFISGPYSSAGAVCVQLSGLQSPCGSAALLQGAVHPIQQPHCQGVLRVLIFLLCLQLVTPRLPNADAGFLKGGCGWPRQRDLCAFQPVTALCCPQLERSNVRSCVPTGACDQNFRSCSGCTPSAMECKFFYGEVSFSMVPQPLCTLTHYVVCRLVGRASCSSVSTGPTRLPL